MLRSVVAFGARSAARLRGSIDAEDPSAYAEAAAVAALLLRAPSPSVCLAAVAIKMIGYA